jgi:putative nucleotidyltransferase with HDIG domain
MDKTEPLLEQKLGSIEGLPTLPVVLRKIQEALQNPKVTMNQISTIVAMDQALVSRSLQLVNSAFYGMRERVSSIDRAIVIIGLNMLHSLMIGLSVVKVFKNSPMQGFSPEEFWEHSFATGLIARKLAKMKGHKDPEQFFVAGLLHDMGRLAMDQFLHEEFSQAIIMAKQQSTPLIEWEKKIIGFDHSKAGAWLGLRWGLPQTFITTIEFHHGDEPVLLDTGSAYFPILKTVSTANVICNIAGIGSSGDSCPEGTKMPAVEGLSILDVKQLVASARSEVKTIMSDWNKG